MRARDCAPIDMVDDYPTDYSGLRRASTDGWGLADRPLAVADGPERSINRPKRAARPRTGGRFSTISGAACWRRLMVLPWRMDRAARFPRCGRARGDGAGFSRSTRQSIVAEPCPRGTVQRAPAPRTTITGARQSFCRLPSGPSKLVDGGRDPSNALAPADFNGATCSSGSR